MLPYATAAAAFVVDPTSSSLSSSSTAFHSPASSSKLLPIAHTTTPTTTTTHTHHPTSTSTSTPRPIHRAPSTTTPAPAPEPVSPTPSSPIHPPVLFDPDHSPRTTAHLDTGFLEEAHRPQLNNYIRHAEVGRGQHGSVYLCHRIDTTLPIGHPNRRLPVAMKSVKRNNPRAEQLKALRRDRALPPSPYTPVVDRLGTTELKIRKEIAIMKKLRHPHVVRLYEIIDDRLREKIYIVMEYLGGGEVKWHDGANRPVLTLPQTRRILRDAVLGLEYLHHQGIIHRDIKPANLL